MKWIAENATGELLNANPGKGFVMDGVSDGGALASCLSRKFQDEPVAHPLTGQWLCGASTMGATNAPEKYEHYHISATPVAKGAGFLKETRGVVQSIVGWDMSSDLRYAINLKMPIPGQQKTYFQIDGMDPLRNDRLIYDETLKEAGAQTKVDLYPGCPHGHTHAFPSLEIADRANVDSLVGMGWLLREEIGGGRCGKRAKS